MRKIVFLLVSLCFFACGHQARPPSTNWFEDNGKLKVLSTTAMIHDLVKDIGGEWIDPAALIVGDVDPHSYELVKGDAEKIARADLFVGNGLNLEHGASLIYQLSHHPHSVFLGDEIRKKRPEKILWMEGELDPHIWMDISLWSEGVDAIVGALSQLDPNHREHYKKNGETLRQKMRASHEKVLHKLQQVPPEKRYLVTSHDAFHYFALAYLQSSSSENRCVAPEGLAPEGQLSSADIQRVIDHLCKYQVGVVFPESNVSRDALRKITSACSHAVKICKEPLYGDAMGEPGSGADSYLGMIEHNADVMKRAWENEH